ncbi:ribonuclease III [Spirulina sp. 06S082]|uniref:ribonuclease III n=1 Tax=Spirulina sp. 06S082 TaxID=3110248 RepID=UPI002B1FAE87|nr:ribonuclease III [Spirulina sp. 06S082]MEA5467917.1 ribonuclease III [Spirulina sp. 06S082]
MPKKSKKIPTIKNQDLLKQALTHRSYVNEHPEEGDNNERLEFLGDAILGFLIGELLYRRYPQINEAKLTRLRSALVDEKQLANFARQIQLGDRLRLGKGTEKDGGRNKDSLLSDTFEALIGAYFLDSGIEAVRNYIELLFVETSDRLASPSSQANSKSLIDSKNRFQQWALQEYGENPEYFLIDEHGPDHAKQFTTGVRVKERIFGVGTDKRKQEAEKRAAEDALKKLGFFA